jgi:hypothetical protein
MPDFEAFQAILLEATRKHFTDLKTRHSDEQFYAFGLFHSPLWASVVPAANTEEGLEWMIRLYQTGSSYSKLSREELRSLLRWIPGDWRYFDVDLEDFLPVQEWLNSQDMFGLLDREEITWDAWEKEINEPMIQVCRETLKILDQEGMFGVGEAREKVVINIMMGDQDGSWLEHAQLLNPPQVYERWIAEVEAGYEVSRRRFSLPPSKGADEG